MNNDTLAAASTFGRVPRQAIVIVDPSTRQPLALPTAGNSGIPKAPVLQPGDVPKRSSTKQSKDHQKQARVTAKDRLSRLNAAIAGGAAARTSSAGLASPTTPSLAIGSSTDGSGSGSDVREFEDEDVERAFNVYATPFVPRVYTSLNTLPGPVFDIPPTKQIDYQSYTHLRLSPSLLIQIDKGAIPDIKPPPPTSAFLETGSLTFLYYEQFFRFHLEDEIVSQCKENATYSLYGHIVHAGLGTLNEPAKARCWIDVPGLRENAPFVEEEDVVELRQLNYNRDGHLLGWTGFIYHTRVEAVVRKEEKLVLKAPPALAINNHRGGVQIGKHSLKFNVSFPVPKERYQPMREALADVQRSLIQNVKDQATKIQTGHSWFQAMLFPMTVHCAMQEKLHSGKFKHGFFDEELNWEQKRAVESICLQNYGTLPYLVSGPPGTGKTKTVIESALQLVHNVDGVNHILVCAPSETAADTLAIRLREHLLPKDLFRLNRATRTFAEVPGLILPYCHVEDNVFALPPMPQLLAYKIVIASCRDADILLKANMTNANLYAMERSMSNLLHPEDGSATPIRLHWAALLIDEAAQAIEPESLLPMAVVAPPPAPASIHMTPRFVMVGDQHQLSPRTSLSSSPLKTSLFARLFDRPVYCEHPLARGKDGKDPPPLSESMLPMLRPAFANLIRNYRSHPAILAVPSDLFYHDTLEAHAADTDALLPWPHWLGRRWPVIFHPNPSPDDLERDGGGWYNLGEVHIAVSYAHKLAQSGLIPQEEICIMSPFKAQVMHIRKALRERNMWGVNAGPTEVFQGMEYSAVIICTTRSKAKFLRKDMERRWGLVGMPNIMNVALTRAKHGLIVIGKRNILNQDPNWSRFIKFCDRNGLAVEKTPRDTWKRQDGPRTRLEKSLLARETVHSGRRTLGVSAGGDDDEMWRNGVRDDGVIETNPEDEHRVWYEYQEGYEDDVDEES